MLEHVDTVLSFAIVMLLLSLLVTALVQIVVTASALRSKILKVGIERLLKQVAPELTEYAAQIADAVVCHPAVAAGKPCTTDIKKDELIQLLGDLATSQTSTLPDNVKALLKDAVKVTTLPQTKVLADTVQAELAKVFPLDSEVAQIKRIVEGAMDRAGEFAANVSTWFNTVMDRTTDEFRKWTRWITIAGAVVLPLIFHIDSLQIVRQLASDPELRANVMQSTDSTLGQAAQVFSLTERSNSLASLAIQEVCKDDDCRQIAAVYKIQEIPGGIADRSEGEEAIREKLKECNDPNKTQMILAAYQKHFDTVADANLQELLQRANEIKASLDASTLTIFAIGEPWGGYWAYWTDGMHILGMLMTVVFLSLGAPFWYNVLRQLSNLRPAIAQKVDLSSQPQG
jgi:hypothetical protein